MLTNFSKCFPFFEISACVSRFSPWQQDLLRDAFKIRSQVNLKLTSNLKDLEAVGPGLEAVLLVDEFQYQL